MTAKASPHFPFPDQPVGTVTFLFTDIEGSTRLLYALRERYISLINDHHKILRKAFSNWKGYEVDTQGDSFFIAFSRATQAIGAAVEAQRNLARHSWPGKAEVLVRMGIHTGEPWNGETGYVGMVVHRAARIANAGHGGQVLLSESSHALVQDELPPGVSLLDLGCYSLKDIHRPERLYQLVIEGLPAEFPPLKCQKALPSEREIFGRLEILQSQDPTRIDERMNIINPVTYLGRKVENDLSFAKDISVSRYHAIIKVRDGKLFLGEVVKTRDDTGQSYRPTCGTFINGLQVQEPVELRDGDEIRLGTSLCLRFKAVLSKPDRRKSQPEQVDPCADLQTMIPESKQALPSSQEVMSKMDKVGNKMPTAGEVRKTLSRNKNKPAPQDKAKS
jgi:class 3 adenylate cyclase